MLKYWLEKERNEVQGSWNIPPIARDLTLLSLFFLVWSTDYFEIKMVKTLASPNEARTHIYTEKLYEFMKVLSPSWGSMDSDSLDGVRGYKAAT